MTIFLILLLIVVIIWLTYAYFKMTINDILDKLVVLDKIFDSRYNDLTKAIAQFQKYMPEHSNLIFDIQKSKADAAKVAKPKTTQELAQKIMNENALTININFLIDKCDFKNIHPDLKIIVDKQVEYIQKIGATANEYNKLITNYKTLKTIFPFSLYTKMIGINLDLDIIKTE